VNHLFLNNSVPGGANLRITQSKNVNLKIKTGLFINNNILQIHNLPDRPAIN